MWNKMLCKNSTNINISFHRCLFDKNVARKLQHEEILSVLKQIFLSLENFCDVRLLLLEIDEDCCINKIHILLCMSWWYTCENHLDRFSGWFQKHSGVTKGCYGQKLDWLQGANPIIGTIWWPLAFCSGVKRRLNYERTVLYNLHIDGLVNSLDKRLCAQLSHNSVSCDFITLACKLLWCFNLWLLYKTLQEPTYNAYYTILL